MMSTNPWKSLVRFISLEGVFESIQLTTDKLKTQEIRQLVPSEDEIEELSRARRARMRLQYEQLVQHQNLIDTEDEADRISL